ncbi:MAG TPA: NTP transferase domain-containing protein [Methanocella sp.]|nr:NTP transferase domain-containing protein [Methanocella sp.]
MDALLMAGGAGTRMGGVEKPLVAVAGRPMIDLVIEALQGCRRVGHVYVAVSPKVPRTVAYLKPACRPGGRLSVVETPGAGYVEVMVAAARLAALDRPFLVIAADLPLVTPDVIDRAIACYEASGKEALSVRLDLSALPAGLKPDTVLTDGGRATVPVGVNIVDGRRLDRPQEELVFVVRDGRLAVNVNYPEDVAACEELMKGDGAHR